MRASISNTFTVTTIEDGEGAPVALASPDKISISCDSSGSVLAQSITSVVFFLKVGTHSAEVTGVSSGTKPTGVTVQGQANNAVTITVGTTATASGMASGVTFKVTGTDDDKTYSATVTVSLIGATQGTRGKVGRFFYYAGTFNTSDTTPLPVSDAQAPFFSHLVNNVMQYHVFNPDTNPSGGQMTMLQMWNASSQSWDKSPWQKMTDNFEYIITKAIFGEYAHFGSFIINGDWLISTNGTIDGDAYDNGATYSGSPAYTWFNPSYPDTDHVTDNKHNFIPNFAVNGLTGDSYVRGTIRATGGTIGGFAITASQLNSTNNNIVLKGSGEATIGNLSVTASGTDISGKVTIGGSNSQGRSIELLPSYNGSTFAAAIVGKESGNELFHLGLSFETSAYIPSLKLTDAGNNPTQIKITNEKIEQNIVVENDAQYKILQGLVADTSPSSNVYGMKYSRGDGASTGGRIVIGMKNNSTAYFRAVTGSNENSAFPDLYKNSNFSDVVKGLVHQMPLSNLKAILDDSTTYYNGFNKYAVLLVKKES